MINITRRRQNAFLLIFLALGLLAGGAYAQSADLHTLRIHKGAMCIVGSSRQYDREYLAGEKDVYEKMIREGVDIIEADLAIQAGMAIKHLAPEKSRKRKYFGFPELH